MDAIEFISMLVREGKKIGIFSCEDPYNTPFHRDLLQITHYMHLVPQAAGRVVPASLDLGLQAKGINAWGVFGHHGVVHGHEVCAAISALNNGHHNYGPHLAQYIQSLASQFTYNTQKTLKENVEEWVKHQYNTLLGLVTEKQRTLKGAVQGDIVVFAGLIENSHDGKDYQARVMFSNKYATGH